MIASAALSAGSSVASTVFSQVLNSIVAAYNNYNPTYNKEARRRMRYIQHKYALAYGENAGDEDPSATIQKIDPNSKILMDPAGRRPANPFPDEKAFEDSLVMNFHPVSGHQGRFAASHVMTCLGVIIDYQNQRRQRVWVPGVMSPGKPNDYINLFLEETKMWLRTQLSLEIVHSEELRKRERFYTKLKNDNYYWCFPPESENCNIHKVIDFVHNKVKSALEIVSREELNKSLQTLFKELNDHTTNFFEFGKLFLAYLLFFSKKAGANIATTVGYDGGSLETGKLHYYLEKATNVVFDTYKKDVHLTNERLGKLTDGQDNNNNNNKARIESVGNGRGGGGGGNPYNNGLMSFEENGNNKMNASTANGNVQDYEMIVKGYDQSNLLQSACYTIQIEDPKGHKWIIKKSWNEFELLHAALVKEITTLNNSSSHEATSIPLNMMLILPMKVSTVNSLLHPQEYHETVMKNIQQYCWQVINVINDFNAPCQTILAKFIETKYIITRITADNLRYAENIPNVFLMMKDDFQAHLLGAPSTTAANAATPVPAPATITAGRTKSNSISEMGSRLGNLFRAKPHSETTDTTDTLPNHHHGNSFDDNHHAFPAGTAVVGTAHVPHTTYYDLPGKEMQQFRQIWGIEYSMKIIEAYAVLQRIATVLGWTLEINHFFISMFGNTVTFSKLPLRDIVLTQKELITKFLVLANDLYTYACQCNAENQYKWHKNLQMTENELTRVRHHGDKLIGVINTIESDHLDYEAQLRRLRDVCSRFQPFMNRVGNSLVNIKEELGLPPPTYTFADYRVGGASQQQQQQQQGPGAGGNMMMMLQDGPAAGPRSSGLSNRNPMMLTNGDMDGDNITVGNNQIEILDDEEGGGMSTAVSARTKGKAISSRSSPPRNDGTMSRGNEEKDSYELTVQQQQIRGVDNSAVCIIS